MNLQQLKCVSVNKNNNLQLRKSNNNKKYT